MKRQQMYMMKIILSKLNEQSYKAMQRSLGQKVSQIAVQYHSNNVAIMGRQKYKEHTQFSRNQQVKSEKVSNTNVPAEEILPHHLPRPPGEILPQHQPRPPETISLQFQEQLCNSRHRHFGFW